MARVSRQQCPHCGSTRTYRTQAPWPTRWCRSCGKRYATYAEDEAKAPAEARAKCNWASQESEHAGGIVP